jgi:hypothetical protein
MTAREPAAIYVDIDDTLVRSVGARRIPIPATVALVRQLAQAGVALYAWSTAGGAYAQQTAVELGIADCFVAFLPKPVALLDDREIKDWRLLELHPMQCANSSAAEILVRLGYAPPEKPDGA